MEPRPRLVVVQKGREDTQPGEVRIAFDGDAVVFGPESDTIYKEQGLDAFLEHETSKCR